MDWHTHFQKVFFDTWQKSGLPHHQHYVNEYIDIREHGDFRSDWIKNSPPISANIHGAQLNSVYGFGVTTGKIFAEMFGLDEAIADDTADWCGRFNLGISLFDYICDEMGGISDVSSLEVFQPFLTSVQTVTSSSNLAQELLSKLVVSVLDDLKKIEGKKSDQAKTNSLFKAMKQMFEAERYISKTGLSDTNKLLEVEKALYLKSAEPFRVMAELTARMAHSNDELLIAKARMTGKALGYCYWLIDDAKDVWIDLKARHWNLFLKLAAEVEPDIFSKSHGLEMEKKLVRIWVESNHAQKISEQIITRLVKAIKRLDLSQKAKLHTLGLVSASLWQWYNY